MAIDTNKQKRLCIALATFLLLILPRTQPCAQSSFTIAPPFWVTWWFPSLVVLAIFAAIFAIHRVRTAMIRNRAEELDALNTRLRESEALHRMIVQDQTEFIVRWKPDGKRIFVNDAYCRYFGLTREEALATSVFSYGSEDHHSLLRSVIKSLTPDSPFSAREFEVMKPGEKEVWHHWSDRGTFDEEGRLLEIQSIGRDITARKTAEAALRTLSIELVATEERERRAMATYLHDEIGQKLAVLLMRMEALSAASDSESIASALDDIRELLDQTIRDTRSLTFDLSPPILYELGLAAAVEWVGMKICSEYDLEFEFTEEGEGLLDPDTAAQLFRAARELMMNVVKHANASRMKALVDINDDAGVRVILQDDGAGFDAEKALAQAHGASGYGLTSIRERMNYIGGHMEIDSRPGCGTTVSLVT